MEASSATANAPVTAPPPVPFVRLKQIANEACDLALSTATTYEHSKTGSWNETIISTILQSLIASTTTKDPATTTTTPPSYKFAVNSTIIQHQTPSSSSAVKSPVDGNSAPTPATAGASGGGGGSARRGMHSATGAYWNNERDGMWSFKYETGEGKGLDVVVSVIWIWVGV